MARIRQTIGIDRFLADPSLPTSEDAERAKNLGGDPHPRPTGQEMFDAMTPAEQDAQFGAAKAEALRAGEVSLVDLVDHSSLETAPDFLTEKPLKDALP